ncbi:hypothetical protein ACHWQZ_G014857 [Mnemiopsis leidyi]
MGVDIITSTVLLLLNIGFICLGGFGMSKLEKPNMERQVWKYMNISNQIVSAANTLDSDMNPIVNMTTFMGDAEVSCSNNKTVPWTYGQSFYFSVSIITTVGWGVLSPSSYSSKAIVCLYALLGIPIYAIFIGLIKEKCGKVFRKLVRVSRDVSWYWIPLCCVILVTLFLNIAVNVAGDMGMKKLKELMNVNCPIITPYTHWQEGASLWDGIYFQFISVSTIGFGDTYLRLLECEGSSADSVLTAISAFILFTALLGMAGHLFDVLSDQSQTGSSSLSSKITKRLSGGMDDRDRAAFNDRRTYGQV